MEPIIQNQNQWWEDKNNINSDPKIMLFDQSKIKWQPACIDEIAKAKPFSLFILRGPRQVGKTTAQKLLIRKLLSRMPAQSLFFFDCEAIFDGKQLQKVVLDYFKFLSLIKIEHPTYIFLDEITSITNWSKVLKFMIDQNIFKNSVVVISGSNAVDLKKGADRLPGRKGHGREISFLPMSFAEFLEVSGEVDVSTKLNKEISLQAVMEGCSKYLPSLPKLSASLNRYLLCGGFPRLANEFIVNNSIPYAVYEDYFNWIKGEITKQKREEKKALQLLIELAVVFGTKVGWDTVAKKMGGVSHHTVEDYVELFDLLYIGKPLYQVDLVKKRISYRKNKKFYFVDGLIYFLSLALAEKWNNIFNRSIEIISNQISQSKFVEQIVFSHLVRLTNNWLDPNLAFFSNSSEIDFILMGEKSLLPIEVKWQTQVRENDFAAMKKNGFKKGLVLSKQDMFQNGKFFSIPTPLFLAMI